MTGMANDFVRDAKFGPRTVPVSAEFFVNGAFIQGNFLVCNFPLAKFDFGHSGLEDYVIG